LAKAEPDVVSLQELKAEQGAFPLNALRTLGYEAVWQGSVPGNGVAILARNHTPVLTCASLPGNPEDHQARYIEAAVQGVLITSIYLPNGNPQPGPKFNYMLAWLERLMPMPPNSWRAAPLGISVANVPANGGNAESVAEACNTADLGASS